MNADDLLDAFGLIDERYVADTQKTGSISWRRRLTVLVAAVVILAMCTVTAMAVSNDFRELVFSIFSIETHDIPPATEESHPTEPGLHEMDTVNIDGQVSAFYFSSGGYLAVCDGGFYTSAWMEAGEPPEDPAFWQITFAGIEEVPNIRVDLPFTHGGKTFRICFDYAVLNGRLSMQVWPEGLDEDPVGNSWNAEPIADRTDVALLTIPVLSDSGWSQDLFLLDLSTLETEELITDVTRSGVTADAYLVSDDLRHGLIIGTDTRTDTYGAWLYDLQSDSMEALEEAATPCFLDNDTILFRRYTAPNSFELVRLHIPTGAETILLESAGSGYCPIRYHRADGRHGLLLRQDGSAALMDFQTGGILNLTGLDTENLICDESPDGSRIMLACQEENGFSVLGILDTETGVLKILSREFSGTESFGGWLDHNTLVITAHDTPNPEMEFTPGDGYYVYVYRFQEKTAAGLSPAPCEPADDAIVRVSDYIPDIVEDLRYATDANFTGEVIYDFSDAWLRYGTVKKLMQVQEELRQHGLRLKIWDGFRPVSAQFRLWEVCPDARYVADPNNGFSSHSRGNTVDVTLVYSDGRELVMPTGFDDFSAQADRDYSDCSAEAAANAEYLEQIMVRYGFKPYSAEWWHYSDTQTYPAEESFQP